MGFATRMLPCSNSGSGLSASEIRLSAGPTMRIHATTRHRGDGSRPLGNRRSSSGMGAMANVRTDFLTQARSVVAGREPGAATSPRRM